MALTFTYDPTTAIGRVRLYIDDRDMSSIDELTPIEQRSVIFADEEVQVFLDTAGGIELLASAAALRAIATNRSLFVQRRKIGRTDVDYGDLRLDLLKLADQLEQQATGEGVPADGIAEVGYDDFSTRRIILNEQLRNNP